MELKQELSKEHSRTVTMRIVDWIGNDQSRFGELVRIFLSSEYRTVQRAAWPLSYCVARHPGLVKKHLKKIVNNLHRPGIHDAVKRNTVRFLQHIDIPEALQGAVMDICFQYVSSPTEATAIKAFSLTILANLARQYPDIIPELKLIIEEQMPHGTPAFKNRASKILKALNV